MTEENLPADDTALRQAMHRVRNEVDKAVVGQAGTVTGLLVSLLARGHVLLEGVPGVAKTLVVRSFARALGLDTKRVQFTPDLMPGDVTGSLVYDARTGEFDFRAGPVFTNILLADEINRTTPKTQSAMLEAMAERQVTVEGNRFPLPQPFHVIATSNPIEYEGTYALPEAQLDRFMVRLSVGYPATHDETRIVLDRVRRQSPDVTVAPVVDADGLRAIQAAVERIHVDEDVARYCVDLARATREAANVAVGASPRGSQSLVLLGRALAALDGRAYVRPDDIKRVAVAVLAHRLTLTPQAWAQGVDPRSIVDAAVASTPVPPTVSATR